MKPRIICHMLASVDGKIDGAALRALTSDGEYEATGSELKGDAWICGRVTMQQHFAESGIFSSKSTERASETVFVARRASSYAVAVDTRGTLLWAADEIDGDHIIAVISEQATVDYLKYLQGKGISYIVAGSSAVDLTKAVSALNETFGINVLLLEGGGNINGGFLDAGLVDEVSLLLVPGIDGRHDVPSVFDGLRGQSRQAVPMRLKSLERCNGDVLWLRYEIVRDNN